MSITISRTGTLLKDALNYRAMRQEMIASNIANVDTPGYKPRDINFEQALMQKKAMLLKSDKDTLKMAQTDASHLKPKEESSSFKPTLYFRDGHMARNDGNSVDIDIETTEMSKNSIMFNAVIAAMKKDGMIYQSVIDASRNVR
ncbi:flagellar basal body rod protein FlgB [Sulfurimonas sp. SAG-AH-194-L11]|nr:flagellar basal body rod protein FlgB [Sulfurimonas sp. SAG-AH-194-L11]MDF1876590.1 flagellar basal body rod protein FlgB [Sulfurimonas sp. SAG-AH-194-L11]